MESSQVFTLALLFLYIGLVIALVYIPYKIAMRLIRGMVQTAKKTWHAIVN